MVRGALIIDDEEDICILLSSFLRKKNFETNFAFTLEEGLKKLKELRPDILFLDNNLPDGSGIETIPAIRSEYREMKIVVISAMSNLREQAIKNSADAFIAKPISFDNIQELI